MDRNVLVQFWPIVHAVLRVTFLMYSHTSILDGVIYEPMDLSINLIDPPAFDASCIDFVFNGQCVFRAQYINSCQLDRLQGNPNWNKEWQVQENIRRFKLCRLVFNFCS